MTLPSVTGTTQQPLVLSLFPGIGLLDMAFEEEGFCVVRGPDLLWGGDIRRFHPPAGRFDGVIGGPPCQFASQLVHLVRANGHRVADNLIPEFERVVEEAGPTWFIMENVPRAPAPRVSEYWVSAHVLRDVEVGGATSRIRRFSFGKRLLLDAPALTAPFAIERLALYAQDPDKAVVCDAREVPVAMLKGGKPKRRRNQTGGTAPHEGPRLSVAEMLRRQGAPEEMLDDCPLTVSGKREAVGNGVPLPMGRAVARAVKRALNLPVTP